MRVCVCIGVLDWFHTRGENEREREREREREGGGGEEGVTDIVYGCILYSISRL